jgi:hypothetical protein
MHTSCLPADPGEQVFVLHQGFLTETARHMQHVELLWRVSQSGIGCQTQTVQVANRCGGLAVEAIGRIGDTRNDFERSGEVDLVEHVEEKRADLQVSIERDH